MSEENPKIDLEAHDLLVPPPDTPPPRRAWTRFSFLFYAILKFKLSILSVESATDSYTSIPADIRAIAHIQEEEQGHTESIGVHDGSSTISDDLSTIDPAQKENLCDQLLSEVINIDQISQTLSGDVPCIHRVPENSHPGVELISRSIRSEDADHINATSQDASTLKNQLQSNQTEEIIRILKEKDLDSLLKFNGIQGVADALNTDLIKGLSDEADINQRKRKIVLQSQIPNHSFKYFFAKEIKKWTIILPSVGAVLSICFGLVEEGPQNGWVDGFTSFIAAIIILLFNSLGGYYYERSLMKKSSKQGVAMKMDVHVTRGESNQCINVPDLVQGDIVLLERGYQVPCDGFYIDGKSLEVDATSQPIIDNQNPFLFYGSRVINGSGRMVVASVDMNTVWGVVMSQTNSNDKKSKVEAQVDRLIKYIYIISLLMTILLYMVSFLLFEVNGKQENGRYKSDPKGEPTKLGSFLFTLEKIIVELKGRARTWMSLVSISLLGVMEAMPFIVSLAIIRWNYNILSESATCRNLLACVKMASATCICTEKTGGLTEHLMVVDTLYVGFEVIRESSMLCPKYLELLCEGIGTPVLMSGDVPNPMEASVCFWAEDIIGFRRNNLNCKVLQHNVSENSSEILLEKIRDGGKELFLHRKGPVKEIWAKCTHYYDREGQVQRMNRQKRLEFQHANTDMFRNQSQTLAFACRRADVDALEGNGLILIGLIGFKDSGKETTKVAIKSASEESSVRTIIVSSDDVSVLEPIAVEHKVVNQESDDLVVKFIDFQNFTDDEKKEKISRIRVLGNCRPADKMEFIKCLKKNGDVVAMVGWQKDDAPALKESNIGVAMGTWNSGVARESSDIIFWNGDLKCVFHVIYCGGYVLEKLQKFVQVQLIMTISPLLINFIGMIITGDAPITTSQLFLLGLIKTLIDVMALLLGPVTEKEVSKITFTPIDRFITASMARNVLFQLSYHIMISIALQSKWHLIKGITQDSARTMIFNTLILCLAFNLFNARELKEKNFFRGILHDYWFLGALVVYSSLHFVFATIVYKLHESSLSSEEWAVCAIIGIISWLFDWVGKFALPASRMEWCTSLVIECAGKCKSVFSNMGWLARGYSLHSQSAAPRPGTDLLTLVLRLRSFNHATSLRLDNYAMFKFCLQN